MNPLRVVFLMACLVAATSAIPGKKMKDNAVRGMKPSDWLSPSQLESMPALDELTLERLESMPLEEGAELIEKYYHISQVGHNIQPSFVPSPSNIPAYIVRPNGEKMSGNLNTFVALAKEQPNFGNQEVTILITGFPQNTETVAKATRKLIQSYLQRYYGQRPQSQLNIEYDMQGKQRTSSEEDYNESWKSQKNANGDLVIIDLGATLTNYKRFALLDVEQTGAMIGKAIVQLTNEANVPQEIVHIVAQGIGAHVAGVAGRTFTRLTGQKLRRITALDPSKIVAQYKNTITGLARGDADFVDAIHTSAYGMGTPKRVGDVDFYPNGPSAGVPGVTNVLEASMRATRYFAESVRPGNERNFPAVAANSLEQYNEKDGHGPRAYMGIDTDFDVKGDYILKVNPTCPFGQNAPADKQITYHGIYPVSRNNAMNFRDFE